MLGEKIYKELVEFTWKVRSNPEHEVRLAANRFLIDFADDLQNDPETIKKAEGIKAEIMGREEVTGLALVDMAGCQAAHHGVRRRSEQHPADQGRRERGRLRSQAA